MNALISSSPADAMSYLPDNPTRERLPDAYQPILFPRSSTPRPAPRGDAWSNQVFWCTVLFLGVTAVTLLAWGAYSGMPRNGNTEKLLQAQLPAPKLKGEANDNQPTQALPIPVPSAEPAASLPGPMKIELPALPMIEAPTAQLFANEPPPVSVPLKIDTPPPVKVELPAVPTAVVIPNPAPVAPLPVMPPPPMVEVVQVLPDQHEPTIFLGRANPGETPMIRTWKTLALYSLLAVAPVAAPAPVVAGGQDDAAKLQKQLEDFGKRLDAAVTKIEEASKGLKTDVSKLQTDVNSLKTQSLTTDIDLGKANTKIENLEKQLGNVQADVNFLKRELSKQVTTASPALDRASLDELKKHLVSIEQAILKLRSAEPTTSRVALSPPAPATGRISLVNMYHEEMLFVINQKTHRVGPRAVIHIDAVPAGALTYEVLSPTWGLRDAKARNLSPNETFTLTVQ